MARIKERESYPPEELPPRSQDDEDYSVEVYTMEETGRLGVAQYVYKLKKWYHFTKDPRNIWRWFFPPDKNEMF